MMGQDMSIKQTSARRSYATPRISIGLVGYGMIGPTHLSAITSHPNLFNIVAVVDSDPKRLSLLEKMGHIKLLSKIDDLLEDSNIEAVVLATPPQTHFSLAKAALGAGKHVLLEKPPTQTEQELRDLTNLALKMNVSLFTAEHSAFNSTVNGLLQLLSGEEIVGIDIVYGENVLDWHPKPYQGVFSDGGAFRDSGYNACSIINRLIPGEIKIISVQRTRPRSGVVKRLQANGEIRQVNLNKFHYESRVDIQFCFGRYGQGRFMQEWFR
ncbi:Gfo/Idh/MocA family oxidoreductase [Candidatus Daviesbacteria bacterium]|nr:Gfo/Idh/MocA family oxidoreductase [Candidatus Daviesbacteria bacterium]